MNAAMSCRVRRGRLFVAGVDRQIRAARRRDRQFVAAFVLRMTRVSLDPLRLVRRDTLFRDDHYLRGAVSTNYDVMPNGQQFVMVENENPDVYPTVFVNWLRRVRLSQR